jgi:hypothetical protein
MKNLLLKLISFLSFRNYNYKPETNQKLVEELKEEPVENYSNDPFNKEAPKIRDYQIAEKKYIFHDKDESSTSAIKFLLYARFRYDDFITSKCIYDFLNENYSDPLTKKQIYRIIHKLRINEYLCAVPEKEHHYTITNKLINWCLDNGTY